MRHQGRKKIIALYKGGGFHDFELSEEVEVVHCLLNRT